MTIYYISMTNNAGVLVTSLKSEMHFEKVNVGAHNDEFKANISNVRATGVRILTWFR